MRSRRRRSPLFSTVVLAGASLTAEGVVACGNTPEAAIIVEDDAGGGTVAEAGSAFSPDSGAAEDSAAPRDSGIEDVSDASCPDGSDRPVPPCYFIK